MLSIFLQKKNLASIFFLFYASFFFTIPNYCIVSFNRFILLRDSVAKKGISTQQFCFDTFTQILFHLPFLLPSPLTTKTPFIGLLSHRCSPKFFFFLFCFLFCICYSFSQKTKQKKRTTLNLVPR